MVINYGKKNLYMKKNIVFVCLSFSSVQFFLHSRVANRSQSQNQQSFNNQQSQETTSDISQDNNDDTQQQNPQQPINNSNSYINNIKTAGKVVGGLGAAGAIVGTVQNKMDRMAEDKEEEEKEETLSQGNELINKQVQDSNPSKQIKILKGPTTKRPSKVVKKKGKLEKKWENFRNKYLPFSGAE